MRASYKLTEDDRDENEVSAAQYWESEWSMYLTSGEFQLDDKTDSFDDNGGGGGGGRSRARGGGAISASTVTVILDNVGPWCTPLILIKNAKPAVADAGCRGCACAALFCQGGGATVVVGADQRARLPTAAAARGCGPRHSHRCRRRSSLWPHTPHDGCRCARRRLRVVVMAYGPACWLPLQNVARTRGIQSQLNVHGAARRVKFSVSG